MKKEMDNSATRKIKLIARHYGKGRLVRQCISCFALLINVFTWWWNNETTRREARSETAEMNNTLADRMGSDHNCCTGRVIRHSRSGR